MKIDTQNPCNIDSKEFWISTWNETLQGTPFVVHKGYATSRFWDNASKNYDRVDIERAKKQIRETLSLFRSNGFLFKDMRVLDIGCGTGRLAFALAQAGADVTALDFSRGMLDSFEKNCPDDLRQRIHPVHADWDSLDITEFKWARSFDLVTAYMTPAIRRPDSFLKMMEVSCGACSLKGWAGKRRNLVLEKLWEHLMGAEMKDRPPDIIFEFNLLYAMGYFPSITFDEVTWERDVTVEDTVIHYLDYFSGVSDESEDVLKRKISAFIESLSENGIIKEKSVGNTGTLFWKV